MRLDERDHEWFEVWHHWGSSGPLNLAVVCKFRDDDAIVLFTFPDGKIWLKSPDYSTIQSELWEDEYSQVKGRELSDDLPTK
jgi:hypothetical protein